MTAAPPPDTHRSRSGRRPPVRALVAVPAAVTALVLALSACGGSASGGATSAAAPAAAHDAAGGGFAATPASGEQADKIAAAAAPADTTATAAGGPTSGVVQARLIRTAQVTIEVSGQLNVAAARVKQVAKQFGGHVESETTGIGDAAEQKGTGQSGSPTVAQVGESLIVLRIPEPKLDDAIAAVTGTPGGKVLSQTSSSQDVTGDIADLSSRVASQKASLERVRALMAKANSLQDVVTLESELSRRQSDLEALESRLATISDQADLSTLTVQLRTPAAKQAKQAEPDTGFLAGLKSGWHAVQVSTTVVLTVLGALLPVVVIAVLIGWPTLRLLRRLNRRTAPPAAAGWPYGSTPSHPGSGSGGPGSADDGAPDGSDQPQPVGTGRPPGDA
jgi:hypothetical protein